MTTTAYESLVQFLRSMRFRFFRCSCHRAISTHIRSDSFLYQFNIGVSEDGDTLIVTATVPVMVPVGCRIAIAETILRINPHIADFDFRLDTGNGHLSLVVSRPVHDIDAVDMLIGEAIEVMDKFVPAMLSVIYGNETPEDALKFV